MYADRIPTLRSLNSILLIVEQLFPKIHALKGTQGTLPTRRFFSTDGTEMVLFNTNLEVVARITSVDIDELHPVDRDLLKVLEDSMNDRFEIWAKVYPGRGMSPDQFINAQTAQRLKQILNEMCGDLRHALRYLEKLNKEFKENYQRHIQFICEYVRS